MSAKLIWKIIAPKPGWAQLALWKKYFRENRTRCLDNPIQQTNSPFLKVFAKASSLITVHAFWVPGIGKKN